MSVGILSAPSALRLKAASRSFTWNISDRIAPHTDTSIITVTNWQEVERRAIAQTNLMVFLLDQTPYGEYYYGNLCDWFPRMLERVATEWPDRPDFPDELQSLILFYFDRVLDVVDEADAGLQFADLWIRPEERKLVDCDYDALLAPFLSLVQHDTYGDYFLFPFVKLLANKRLASRAQMDEHVEATGEFYMRDYFELPHKKPKGHPDDRTELTEVGLKFKTGKKYAILFGGERASMTPFGGGGGSNFRRCGSTTTCITSPAGWCSISSSGQCTSG